jgi:hypothetical protein
MLMMPMPMLVLLIRALVPMMPDLLRMRFSCG